MSSTISFSDIQTNSMKYIKCANGACKNNIVLYKATIATTGASIICYNDTTKDESKEVFIIPAYIIDESHAQYCIHCRPNEYEIKARVTL
jgi:hypothetical protein